MIVEIAYHRFRMGNGLCVTNENTVIFKATIPINKELIEKAIASNISKDKFMEIAVKHIDEMFEDLNQKTNDVIDEDLSALGDKEKKNIEVPIII